MQFNILNTREIKRLKKQIENTYQAKNLSLDYIFLKNKKGKVYILSVDFKNFDTKKLHMNRLGLYFCRIEKDGIRLSIEGSQLIGKHSKKIIDLNKKEIEKWVSGKDIKKKCGEGYFIISHGKDIYGVAKAKNNVLRNFVPKRRRIKKQS